MGTLNHVRQPSLYRGIDWSNRFSRGMRALFVGAYGQNDLVTWAVGTPGSSSSFVAKKQGRAFKFDGTNNSRFAYSGLRSLTGNIGTLAIMASRIGFYDTNGMVIFGTNTTNSVFFQLPNSFQNAFCFGQAITGIDPATYLNNTVDKSLVFTSNSLAAGKKLYIDAVSRGTADANAPVSFVAGTKSFQFGAWIGGNTWDCDMDIEIMLLTVDVWNAEEVVEWTRNPYQVLLPDDDVELGQAPPGIVYNPYAGLHPALLAR